MLLNVLSVAGSGVPTTTLRLPWFWTLARLGETFVNVYTGNFALRLQRMPPPAYSARALPGPRGNDGTTPSTTLRRPRVKGVCYGRVKGRSERTIPPRRGGGGEPVRLSAVGVRSVRGPGSGVGIVSSSGGVGRGCLAHSSSNSTRHLPSSFCSTARAWRGTARPERPRKPVDRGFSVRRLLHQLLDDRRRQGLARPSSSRSRSRSPGRPSTSTSSPCGSRSRRGRRPGTGRGSRARS